ncbi:preprotein translocase subunit YajC [Arthrobacter sp. JZ12]|uniref:preprotein translocase subunit YajC n=1 Tax=Arthrobacter sp. JZ12 TaxID=2654190 RepID=UPI002B473F9F|nr:preprotein translocase subunit YajC [Arthrobacter sp. JZ12]WRH24846.1 preprotein translocase subunit YajC [Arthrobacter sp. JZ12]
MLANVVAQSTQPAGGGFDIFSLLLPLALIFLIFTMFRKQRKMKQEVAEQRTQMVPGTEVMTNFGLFGTIVSLDEDNNKALIEISPGVTATVHSQTLSKVVTPEPAAEEPGIVPDDASSLTHPADADTERPVHQETPEETVERLNRENARERDRNDRERNDKDQ